MARYTFEPGSITWPDRKAFAFTIFDDTDDATVENSAPVYEFLKECGFRTTKSVWPLATPDAEWWRGDTCETPHYLDWVKRLQAQGFEIGYHGASCVSSVRERTIEGLARFSALFGRPEVCSNHCDNLESIYFGEARVTGLARGAYLILSRFKTYHQYSGHVEASPYFWGDVCQREVDFVRNFVYADINTLKKCPYMPYVDPARPYVKAWYASSNADEADAFCRLISGPNQERLERERGACIVYTHLARKYVRGGELRKDFRELMIQLSRRNGWFVPVGCVLRHLREQHGGVHRLSNRERQRLEWNWLRDKCFLGST